MSEITPAEITGFQRLARGAELFLGGIGRGAAKAAVPLAIGGGGALVLHEYTGYTNAAARRDNPPAQVIPIPKGGQEGVFDPKTGTFVLVGQGPPAQKVTGPDRAVEDTVQKGLLYAGLAAVAIVAVVVLKGGK